MAMENQELLEALRYIIKEETRAVVKEEIQPINSRLDNMDSRLDHKGLVDTMHDIKKDTGRIETIETELFATKEVTKDNVQNIKKLQAKRKI